MSDDFDKAVGVLSGGMVDCRRHWQRNFVASALDDPEHLGSDYVSSWHGYGMIVELVMLGLVTRRVKPSERGPWVATELGLRVAKHFGPQPPGFRADCEHCTSQTEAGSGPTS